jgi:site-specific DNA recombinase
LVSEEDFVAQAIHAPQQTGDGATRTYLLAGLLRCELCRRRMDSHWVNDRPGYRCRHGHTSAKPPTTARPRNLYLREDTILTDLATKLSHITKSRDPHSLAEYLRTNAIMIVCGYTSCSISSENTTTAH